MSMTLTASATANQIRMMKHAIGFEQRRVRRGKYVAWRNYFFGCGKDFEWEKLVGWGLAVKREEPDDKVYYHVSEKGFEFLGDILGVKIVEDD